MSSSKAYLQFVLEQLSDLKEITYSPMMDEYLLYYTRLYCKIYNFAMPAMHCRWWLCHQEPPFILSSQSQRLCSRF